MSVKRRAGAAAIALAIGLSALTSSAGQANAVPLDPPPPCPDCQPGPVDEPLPPPPPTNPCDPALQPRRVGPGSPRGGGGQPSYPLPRGCPAPRPPGS
jgi:hypothetical protein